MLKMLQGEKRARRPPGKRRAYAAARLPGKKLGVWSEQHPQEIWNLFEKSLGILSYI
jgi:hypothetical protein